MTDMTNVVERLAGVEQMLRCSTETFVDCFGEVYQEGHLAFRRKLAADLRALLLHVEEVGRGSSNASPSPLDAARHRSQETPAPSGRWRKRPVVIDAIKAEVLHGHVAYWPEWAREARRAGSIVVTPSTVVIGTMEGDMRAQRDDWIIRGVKGELYPRKPDIFAATYEPAESASARLPQRADESPGQTK